MRRTKRSLLTLLLMLLVVFSPVSANAAAKVKLNKAKVTLTAGKSTKLKLKNNKKKVKWSSSNKKVATVNSKGKVSAKKQGTAKITAKVGAKKYTCKVTVKSAPKKTTAKKTKPTKTEKQTEAEQDTCKLYGHTWGPQTILVQPTCAKEGCYTHTCYWCGTTEKVTIPKMMNHTWQAVSHHTPTQKENWVCDTVKCTVCGVTSEEKCLDPGAPGHPDYWTLAGGEAEALNRIKLYRQNQDKIHDPNDDDTSSCNGWAIELNEYIWQIGAFAPAGSTKNTYVTGDPGLQLYDPSLFDPLYDLRVGDAYHYTYSNRYYTGMDGNKYRDGHWEVITDIQRDASGKMIRYRWADCGTKDTVLHGIPRWSEDHYWITGPYGSYWLEGHEGGYCDASELTRRWGTGKLGAIDQVMTFWPNIWTKVQ